MDYNEILKTRYECPECNMILKQKLITKPLRYIYEHSELGIVWLNGYPCICDNSNKLLTEKEINKIDYY